MLVYPNLVIPTKGVRTALKLQLRLIREESCCLVMRKVTGFMLLITHE